MNNKKFRSEWKYICSEQQLKKISLSLVNILKRDKYSNINKKDYVIQSLYFDDINNKCMLDNDAGLGYRYKYRIRYYGDFCGTLSLEKKIKYNSRCYKESCKLTISQYQMILENNYYSIISETDSELLKKFCIDCIVKCFRPVVIVRYEREAFVDETLNIRITIDRNISASKDITKFLDGTYARHPIQDKNMHVLEIKFDDILPSYIRKAVNINQTSQITFSKYYLSRTTLGRL